MNIQSQRGVVLLISLVLLLLLTTIAITASNQATLQQRMAANSQQQNSAFQAAESGLQAWADQLPKSQVPAAFTATLQSWPTGAGQAQYNATAGIANNCADVIPAFSMDVTNPRPPACYEIQSTGQSCPDAACNTADNPATAIHIQGYLAY